MLAINAAVMFLLTHALIDRLGHFFPHLNRMYMAMATPMALLMLFVRRSMYRNIAQHRPVQMKDILARR